MRQSQVIVNGKRNLVVSENSSSVVRNLSNGGAWENLKIGITSPPYFLTIKSEFMAYRRSRKSFGRKRSRTRKRRFYTISRGGVRL